MDFWSGLLIVAATVLLAWYGLGMLISRNIFARWFFETKIVRGYEKEKLEKLRGKRFLLGDFSKDPELGEKFSQILTLCGAELIFRSGSFWMLTLIQKTDDTMKFRLVGIASDSQQATEKHFSMDIDRFRDPFLFLIRDVVPKIEGRSALV